MARPHFIQRHRQQISCHPVAKRLHEPQGFRHVRFGFVVGIHLFSPSPGLQRLNSIKRTAGWRIAVGQVIATYARIA